MIKILAETALRTIRGTAGTDVLIGTNADEQLLGLAGKDSLTGNGGDDLLDGGAGDDIMRGGAGDDTYVVDAPGDKVIEAANDGVDTVLTGRAVYKLGKNVENLTFTSSTAHFGSGNALANTINGAGGADNLHGGGGDDTLLGGGGADLLYGGIGNDLLDGGTGADLMLGGKGNDTYVVDSARDRVLESRDRGTDLVKASITYALGSNVENLELTGSRAINGTGNKLANELVGNEAKNTLSGGRGDDVLDGKGGADRLVGGLGADHFVFSTDPAGGNLDVVSDFSSAQGDHVVLDRSVFTAFDGRGSVSASALLAGDGVHAADKATQHLIYDSTSGALYYDEDGAGGTRAVQIATLIDAPALTAADFLLIG